MAESETTVLDQAKLVLAEKRTFLAMLRTGIAVLALPITVTSFLIAFSSHYDAAEVLPLLAPLLVACLLLGVFGVYLVFHSLRKLKKADLVLTRLKAGHKDLRRLIA